MQVVLDTNVLVAGLRSHRGASFQLLSVLPKQHFTFLISVPLLLEYEAVLKRPEHLQAMGLDEHDIDLLLNLLAAKGKRVKLFYLWRPQLTDPKDEMVLELAANGQAEAIVTFNQKHFRAAAPRFGIAIFSPKEFYVWLKQRNLI